MCVGGCSLLLCGRTLQTWDSALLWPLPHPHWPWTLSALFSAFLHRKTSLAKSKLIIKVTTKRIVLQSLGFRKTLYRVIENGVHGLFTLSNLLSYVNSVYLSMRTYTNYQSAYIYYNFYKILIWLFQSLQLFKNYTFPNYYYTTPNFNQNNLHLKSWTEFTM